LYYNYVRTYYIYHFFDTRTSLIKTTWMIT